MDLQLTHKIVIVTGAASGRGKAPAPLLTEEGAIVVGVDRDPIDTGPGARGTAVQADLTDAATPDRVIAIVLEQHGRIDALVNNAGGLQARTSFLDITAEQWLTTFNLNFHAARRMSRAAVPAMLASGGAGPPPPAPPCPVAAAAASSTSAATPRGCRKSATSTTRRPNFRCWRCPPHWPPSSAPKASGRTSWSPDPPAPRSTTDRAASATRPPRCGAPTRKPRSPAW